MPEICENWLVLVNRCVYYAHQTHGIYQVLHHSAAQWISKLPGSFEIYWVRQYLVNVVLFAIKDLETSEMTVKLKSNLYDGFFSSRC